MSGFGWLRRAALTLEAHPHLLLRAQRVRGFQSGGVWMTEALASLRQDRSPPPTRCDFARVGFRKYGRCGLAAGAVGSATAALVGPVGAAACGLIAFYAVEARQVFDFPAAIDYRRRAGVASRALVRRAGGAATVMTRVLPIALYMLFGGLLNGRPRRCWTLGCLAVLLWYESERRREGASPPVVDLGARAPLMIRRVGDRHPGRDPIRVLFASDLHLGAYGATRAMRELVRVTTRVRPDVVLLGGDLVDTRRALPRLGEWTRRLSRHAAVAAIPGNHDARWHDAAAAEVTDAGGHWLPRGPLTIRGLRIDGVPTRGRPDGLERRVLCAHHPAALPTAATFGYDAVLAGHLHGGQMILCDIGGRHYPGALYSRWTGPTFKSGSTRLWVSRGVADTLPARFRCPREVLLATFADVPREAADARRTSDDETIDPTETTTGGASGSKRPIARSAARVYP